tara:strand:- start:1297 stop:2127 length:831 start_codon:yes stop_codon:yes gene_type:complete
MVSPWQKEWKKFTPSSIENMKAYSDKTHEEREWMTYVYDVNNKYELGEVSYGGLSRIEVSPKKKAVQDRLKSGLMEKDRKWTIHGHPLKDGKIYTGRQYFSSTDICREFVKSRDNNEYISQFLVFPHKQKHSRTNKEVFHNRVRVLVFPNKEIITRAMKASNPHVNPMTISVNSGQNHQVDKPDGSISLENESKVNWFAFQEALGKLGYMGIVDIEGPSKGAKVFNSEAKIRAGNLSGVLVIGVLLLGLVNINKKSKGHSAENIQVIDDLSMYMKY